MSFPLIGNERLKNAVESFIGADRIPHALLIEGEKGIGKHTLAKYITEAAVCTAQDAPCYECNSCHLAKVGSHPDIVNIAPENGKKNISVEQIRSLRQQAFIKAHIADRRVFIIEKADTMNEQSQNALLKVLEEPPQGVIFILIASSRTALLDTIVSRCVTLSPAIPEHSTAAKHIAEICDADASRIDEALQASSGCIGRALELLGDAQNDKIAQTACEFLELLIKEDEWGMLKLLAPFEKDRAATDALFSALKVETVRQLRKCRGLVMRSRMLNRFYDRLGTYEELLKTNINLSLLFCALVSCNSAG